MRLCVRVLAQSQILEIPEVRSLSEFLEIFETPVDIIMEADRVWPPGRQEPY